jgi:hypothetical protein
VLAKTHKKRPGAKKTPRADECAIEDVLMPNSGNRQAGRVRLTAPRHFDSALR